MRFSTAVRPNVATFTYSFVSTVVCVAACFFVPIALERNARAIDVTQSPVFVTEGQSLFENGDSLPPGLPKTFVGLNWNESGVIVPRITDPITGSYIELNGSSTGKIGVEYELKLSSGTLNATLPYDVRLVLPDFTDMQDGDFNVSFDSTFQRAGASFSSTSPTLEFYADLVAKATVGVTGTGAAKFPWDTYEGDFGDPELIKIVNSEAEDGLFRSELVGINRDKDGEVRLLKDAFEAVETVKSVFSRAKATGKLIQDINKQKTGQDKVKVFLDALSFQYGLQTESLFTANVNLPYIELGGSLEGGTPSNVLKQSGFDEFASLEVDLDRLVSIIFPQVPPMTAKAEFDFVAGSVTAEATALDVDFVPKLNVHQTEEVRADGISIDFDFGRAANFRIVNSNDNTVAQAEGMHQTASLLPGQRLEFVNENLDADNGGSPINLTPTYKVDAKLKTQFGASLGASIDTKLLSGSMEAELLGLFSTGPHTLGPVAEPSIDFGTTNPVNFYSSNYFTLGGFNDVLGATQVLTLAGQVWDGGGDGTSMFGAAGQNNWHEDVQPTGQDLEIDSGTGPAIDAVVNQSGSAGNLTVRTRAKVIVPGGKTLTITKDINVDTPNRVGLEIQDTGAVTMTKAINGADRATISGDGTILLAGANAQLGVTHGLRLVGSRIEGRGSLTVGENMELDQGILSASGGTLGVATKSIKHLADGGIKGRIQAFGGATLSIQTEHNNGAGPLVGIERSGGAAADRLELLADNGSTIAIIYPTPAVPFTAFDALSTIDSVRFMSKASGIFSNGDTGKVRIGRDVRLSNIRNDGNVEVFKDGGIASSTQVELTGGAFANNGRFVALQETSVNLTPAANVTLAGTGTVELQGSSLSGPNGTKLINDAGHTVRLTGSGAASNATLGADAGGNGPTVENLGTIEAELTFGATASLRAKSAAGSFVNSGTIRATGASTTLELASGSFDNQSVFEATAGGKIEMGNTATLENLSPSGDLVLHLGTYRIINSGGNTSSIALKTPNTSTNFVNAANIELLGEPAAKSNFTINGVDLFDMTTVVNELDSKLTLGPGRKLQAQEVINSGTITLQGGDPTATEIGDVTNELTGVVEAVAGVGGGKSILHLSAPDAIARNQGTISAVKEFNDAGNIELRVKSPGLVFRNEGLVEVRNANLIFDELDVDSGGVDGTFESGEWIVEGYASFTPATLHLNLASGASEPEVLKADVTMFGTAAKIRFNDSADFEETINRIEAGGRLTLGAGKTSEFANGLTIAAGEVVLEGGTLKTAVSERLENGSTLRGAGTVGSGEVLAIQLTPEITIANGQGTLINNNLIRAEEGVLTIEGNVANNGLVRAVGQNPNTETFAGSISLYSGVIAGGNMIVDDGAGLVSDGNYVLAGVYYEGVPFPSLVTSAAGQPLDVLVPASLANDGIIGTGSGDLQIVVNPAVINAGEMIAKAGRTLRLIGLNDTGVATLNNPGIIRVIWDVNDSEPGLGFNSTLLVDNVRIDGGEVEVRGARVPGEWIDRARVIGHNALLDNVVIDIDLGVVLSDMDQSPFVLLPKVGVAAEIVDSFMIADKGGILALVGEVDAMREFKLSNSIVLATGKGAASMAPSRIQFSLVSVTGGILTSDGLGEIHITGDSRFSNVSSGALVTVDAGKTLTLSDVFHNRHYDVDETTMMVEVDDPGTLEVRGKLRLDGLVAIGGPITSGSDFLEGTLDIKAGAEVNVLGEARILGADILNHGAINLGIGDRLEVNESNDNATSAPSFTNEGAIDIAVAGELFVHNARMANTGDVSVRGGITVGAFDLQGGTLSGTGTISGLVNQTGGTFEPGNSPGTMHVGAYIHEGGDLHIEVASLQSFDRVVADSGNVLLFDDGRITMDLAGVPREDEMFDRPRLFFDIFDVPAGGLIRDFGANFRVVDAEDFVYHSFKERTGTVLLVRVPEPSAIVLAAVCAVCLSIASRQHAALSNSRVR